MDNRNSNDQLNETIIPGDSDLKISTTEFQKSSAKKMRIVFFMALGLLIINVILGGVFHGCDVLLESDGYVIFFCIFHTLLLFVVPLIQSVMLVGKCKKIPNNQCDTETIDAKTITNYEGWVNIFANVALPLWLLMGLIVPAEERHTGDSWSGLIVLFYMIIMIVMIIISNIISYVAEIKILKLHKRHKDSVVQIPVSKTLYASLYLKLLITVCGLVLVAIMMN